MKKILSPPKRPAGKKRLLLLLGLLCLAAAVIGFMYLWGRTASNRKPDLENDVNVPDEFIEVIDPDLREMLGDKYVYFTECFDTIGHSVLSQDGIFINGFERGIAPCMGGALCMDREGYLYVREDATLDIKAQDNGTLPITGDAINGANMATMECSIEYVVFYFGDNAVSVLDRAPYLSGMGVSFTGQYFKYKS